MNPRSRSEAVPNHGPTGRASPAPVPPRADVVAIGLPGLWVWLSLAAALTAAVGSVVGLLAAERIYGQETATLADTATAQDAVNLAVVVPLIVVLGVRASQGSVRAYVCWLGCLAFTVYNYAIYAFSIHFGPLFLPWVAVLGLCFYALVGSLATVDATAVKNTFSGRALPLTAWALIAFAVLFMLLWLGQIVPDLLAGNPSRSADGWNVPTNPVHVLDLALFLPAVLTSGVLLLRRHAVGYATAPGQLVFLALTCLPIFLTPPVAVARSHEPGWAVLVPIGIVLTATLVILWRTLRSATDLSDHDPRDMR
jgi:hypothetical protein